MSEFTNDEKEEFSKILDGIEQKIKEARPKCTEPLQLEILDEIEKLLPKKRLD